MSKVNNNPYEVNYANYLLEFMNFYDNHKNLCDEIAGLKKRINYKYGERIEFYIKKTNFIYAIRRLSGFLINNIHYIKDKTRKQYLEKKIDELETEFNNDKKYKYYAEQKRLSLEDSINFNFLYFQYVYKCFELSYMITEYLQESLMVSVGKITKSLLYYDTNKFYENLSNYREEVSNNISNFIFKDSIDHFKKILAFHYTYRIFISKKDTYYIDKLINYTYSYILSPDVVLLIKKEKLTTEDKNKIYSSSKLIRNTLAKIYELTNEGLSEKRILPKVRPKILIDKTLI